MEKYPYMQDDNNMKLHPSTNYKTGKQLKLRKLNLKQYFQRLTPHIYRPIKYIKSQPFIKNKTDNSLQKIFPT